MVPSSADFEPGRPARDTGGHPFHHVTTRFVLK
jgi:hypothetical protein